MMDLSLLVSGSDPSTVPGSFCAYRLAERSMAFSMDRTYIRSLNEKNANIRKRKTVKTRIHNRN